MQTFTEKTGQTLSELIKEYDEVKRKIDVYHETLEERLDFLVGHKNINDAKAIISAMKRLEFGSPDWRTLWCVSNDIMTMEEK